MSLNFEELDFQSTPLGEISLRKRAEPRLGGKILYEVKLGDEFLMSSLFASAEIALTKLALQQLEADAQNVRALDVIVGGLGLGYTAAAALEDADVAALRVIEIMAPVIDWHQRELVPLGATLCNDPRCELVLADFFALATHPSDSFYPGQPERQADAILLDIDHSPSHWLNQENRHFYTAESLSKMADKLRAGGVFGLWSNEPPQAEFEALLQGLFTTVNAHIISFDNPYREQASTNTVYIATR